MREKKSPLSVLLIYMSQTSKTPRDTWKQFADQVYSGHSQSSVRRQFGKTRGPLVHTPSRANCKKFFSQRQITTAL